MSSVITPVRIAALIEDAPAWPKIGLTVPNERLRADAHLELARYVYSGFYNLIQHDFTASSAARA